MAGANEPIDLEQETLFGLAGKLVDAIQKGFLGTGAIQTYQYGPAINENDVLNLKEIRSGKEPPLKIETGSTNGATIINLPIKDTPRNREKTFAALHLLRLATFVQTEGEDWLIEESGINEESGNIRPGITLTVLGKESANIIGEKTKKALSQLKSTTFDGWKPEKRKGVPSSRILQKTLSSDSDDSVNLEEVLTHMTVFHSMVTVNPQQFNDDIYVVASTFMSSLREAEKMPPLTHMER